MGVFTRPIKKSLEPVPTVAPDKSQSANNWSSYELKNRIHRHLIERIELTKVDVLPRDVVEQQIRQVVEDLLADEETPLSRWERHQIILEIQHETFGLGPIEPLIRDPSVSDILVNGPHSVFVE